MPNVRALIGTVVFALLALTGCSGSTTPPEYPSSTVTQSLQPPTGLPTDASNAAGNSHIAFGSWGVVLLPDGTQVGVRLNGGWQGTPGMLSERIVAATPLGNTTVDLATATPFFLSWSYLVIQGDPEAVPILEVMPGTQGTLYQITSAYSDYDCPDYELSYDRGIGVEVRHCLVTLSSDSATPRAIAIKVPQLREYWFFDPPENFITLKPA